MPPCAGRLLHCCGCGSGGGCGCPCTAATTTTALPPTAAAAAARCGGVHVRCRGYTVSCSRGILPHAHRQRTWTCAPPCGHCANPRERRCSALYRDRHRSSRGTVLTSLVRRAARVALKRSVDVMLIIDSGLRSAPPLYGLGCAVLKHDSRKKNNGSCVRARAHFTSLVRSGVYLPYCPPGCTGCAASLAASAQSTSYQLGRLAVISSSKRRTSTRHRQKGGTS
jgi:hypothetical protein